jgi:hypothetical protein
MLYLCRHKHPKLAKGLGLLRREQEETSACKDEERRRLANSKKLPFICRIPRLEIPCTSSLLPVPFHFLEEGDVIETDSITIPT